MKTNVLKTTRGIGIRNDMINVKKPRRDETNDIRVMCSHRSIDKSVIISREVVPKYTPLTNPIVDTVLKILRINNLSLERYSRLGAAIKGLAIDRYKNHRSPVHSKEYETVFSETSSSKSSPKSVHFPSLLQERK